MTQFITGLTGLLYFLSISLATRQHFRSDRYPPGMYVISTLSLVGIFTFLIRAFWQQLSFVPLTVSMILCAFGLFVWSIRHSRDHQLSLALDTDMQSSQIIRTGPWKYMRHPFYASYLIFWLACALGAQHVVSTIVFLCLTAIYVYSALKEEGALSTGPLRKDYREYQRDVGFLFPKLALRSHRRA